MYAGIASVLNKIFILCLGVLLRAAINMPKGVTPISRDIYDLHMMIFYICLAAGVLTFGVIIYTLLKHRKSRGVVPAKFEGNVYLEVVWTVVPLVILIGMVYPAAKVLLRMEDTSEASVSVLVTGIQWKWRYDYLDDDISFYSNLATSQDEINGIAPKGEHYLLEVDKPIVVPIHQKIRFLFTSQDVIHSWWVPDLGIKVDAMPGYISEAWAYIEKPGIYRGQCTELCGMMHGFMPIVLEAKTQEDYQAWITNKGVDKEHVPEGEIPMEVEKKEIDFSNLGAVKSFGEGIYKVHCTACHKADGKGMPPVFPSFVGTEIVTGPPEEQIKILLLGVVGKAMQSYADQLTDEEIAAVITYERNAWGNNDKGKYGEHAGGIITPKMVSEMRSKLGVK
ncbi:cytochrome c oxidase subunit II [Gammaproteobacteria bacterium]|nr:cytochrome c oxidase subunit II [Gammaproteobacteria bacterium]